ncbi:MAG: MCE family protein [Solirubrobacterales bacterium]|nr:MCE family protein [Solirubrobacterales bacterium]
MRNQISKYSRDFIAVILLAVVALVVGGYILSNQRFYLPKSVPLLGSDFVDYKAEFTTAQSVTPGQGQTINVAGVPVGEISKVNLVDGRAVITMKIRRKYTPIYKDASALLRPKTGLNDMIIELTPGTRRAGELDPDKARVPVSQTLPNVNADEVLAGLDGETRDYLKLLVNGAGEALGGNGKNLSATFRRFEPTSRDLLKLTQELAKRRENIKRSIHNFRRLTEAVGEKDTQLAQLIDASNAVFKSFANQDANLRQTLRLLPDALQTTDTTLVKAKRLGDVLGPSLGKLRPGARALGPSLRQTRPFLEQTTPIIKDQIRPFTRAARPTVADLRPAARDLAALTPDFTRVLEVANYLLNTLAYNPPGEAEEGYLFWTAWTNHLGPTVFSTQDAHGPIRRGAILLSCSVAPTLTALQKVNPQLGTIIDLTNLPLDACAKSSQAPGTTAPGSTGSGTGDLPVPSVPTATTASKGR